MEMSFDLMTERMGELSAARPVDLVPVPQIDMPVLKMDVGMTDAGMGYSDHYLRPLGDGNVGDDLLKRLPISDDGLAFHGFRLLLRAVAERVCNTPDCNSPKR